MSVQRVGQGAENYPGVYFLVYPYRLRSMGQEIEGPVVETVLSPGCRNLKTSLIGIMVLKTEL